MSVDLPTTAREVFRREADAVLDAARRLEPAAFTRAVDLLAGCAGIVATTGVGTSGIVARKLAATLTSTGTPATFVHPADALHGGLGLIGSREVVVAFSNSGETDELSALLPYLDSRSVDVIAIVGNLDSTLGRRATVALDAQAEAEAGPHGIVPTASVAVALAVGDALALTVMDRNEVPVERFAANHPSGRLGRRLTLRVRDVMLAAEVVTPIDAARSLLDVVQAISTGGAGAAVIVGTDDGLAGIVTDGDVRRAVARCDSAALFDLTAADMMNAHPTAIGGETMAYDALRLMEDRSSQISVLPVVDEGRYRGLVRLHDLVRLGL